MQVLGTSTSVSPIGVVATVAALLATAAWGELLLEAEINPDPATTPFTTGGGSCPGSTCSAGESMTWNLPVLAMGESVTVGFNEDATSGTSIPIEVELL